MTQEMFILYVPEFIFSLISSTITFFSPQYPSHVTNIHIFTLPSDLYSQEMTS